MYSICKARYKMTHGPVPVHGPGFGDDCHRLYITDFNRLFLKCPKRPKGAALAVAVLVALTLRNTGKGVETGRGCITDTQLLT